MSAEAYPNPQSYAQQKLAELSATQGLKVIKNIEDLYAPDIWPEDDIEDFLAWLERCRQGEE